MLQGVRISWDSDRTAGPRFRCQHHGLGVKESLHLPAKRAKPLPQRITQHRRQALIQPRGHSSWDVRIRRDVARVPAVHEIHQALGGCRLGLARSLPAQAFHVLLETQSSKWSVKAQRFPVGGLQLHNHAGIRVRVVSLRRRPTVGHHLLLACRTRGNDSPRAHAEAVNTPPLHLTHKAVARGRKPPFHLFSMVLHAIQPTLGMLHPHAHGKWLGLHRQPAVVEQLKHVPGAVARREDACGSRQGSA